MLVRRAASAKSASACSGRLNSRRASPRQPQAAAEAGSSRRVLGNGRSLHVVDRFFLKVRYKVNALDRHRQTASAGPAWNVYHPYNPGRVPALLTTIYRLWHNWSLEAKDGTTPAMRAGLAARPLNPKMLLEQGIEAAAEEMRTPLPEPPPQESRRKPEEDADSGMDFSP